jgi:hypothetical protein
MVERRRRENQYIRAKGSGALVEGASMHDRLAGADCAAHRRYRIARIEGIVDRGRARRRWRCRKAAVGMQIEPGGIVNLTESR